MCGKCGSEASLSQRLIDGMPARYNDPVVVIGASEFFMKLDVGIVMK